MICESPHSIDVDTKITRAMTKIRFVPNRSPSHPAAGITAASARRYPIAIHSMSVVGTPNSRAIVGSATLTIVPSMTVMKRAKM